MIRINLLPVKRKKKPKPLPTFVVSGTFIALFLFGAFSYLYFYYDSKLKETKGIVEANKRKIAQLKETIKEVDGFENLNKTYLERNQIIEQLRKNQNIPAMMLDEISKDLPQGVWLKTLSVSGNVVSLEGYAFSNSEVVAYVDNLKNSRRFADVFLQ